MNVLIRIEEKEGKQVVSARELYKFLSSDAKVSTNVKSWMERNIVKNKFLIENIDFQIIRYVNEYGRNMIDYALTIDSAKELSMLSQCEKGKQARLYFIECERKLKEQKPVLSQIEILQYSVNLLVEQQKQIQNITQRVQAIEERPAINAPIEHFSILGYARNVGMQITLKQAQRYSWKCKTLCDSLGLNIGKISDPRFGTVNTYPLDVLKEIVGE